MSDRIQLLLAITVRHENNVFLLTKSPRCHCAVAARKFQLQQVQDVVTAARKFSLTLHMERDMQDRWFVGLAMHCTYTFNLLAFMMPMAAIAVVESALSNSAAAIAIRSRPHGDRYRSYRSEPAPWSALRCKSSTNHPFATQRHACAERTGWLTASQPAALRTRTRCRRRGVGRHGRPCCCQRFTDSSTCRQLRHSMDASAARGEGPMQQSGDQAVRSLQVFERYRSGSIERWESKSVREHPSTPAAHLESCQRLVGNEAPRHRHCT